MLLKRVVNFLLSSMLNAFDTGDLATERALAYNKFAASSLTGKLLVKINLKSCN